MSSGITVISGGNSDGLILYTGFGSVRKNVTEGNREKDKLEGDEYKYATIHTFDKLSRQIKQQAPFEMGGNSISYLESKTYYAAAGNVAKTKVKANKTGEPEKCSAIENTYDWRGLLTMTCQVGDVSSGNLYTYYLYDIFGNKVREYSGLHTPLDIDWESLLARTLK